MRVQSSNSQARFENHTRRNTTCVPISCNFESFLKMAYAEIFFLFFRGVTLKRVKKSC